MTSPISEKERDAFLPLINELFDKYRGASINLPAVTSFVLQGLNVQPENYHVLNERVTKFVHELCAATALGYNMPKGYEMRTGKGGGISRLGLGVNKVPTPIQDNYTCKTCSCTKLSTHSDKLCWRCGTPVEK